MDTLTRALNGGAGATVEEANRLLWDLNHPWKVWVVLGMVGLVATVFMVIYYYRTKSSGISSNGTDPK